MPSVGISETAIIATAATVASTAISAYGAIQSGQAQSKAAAYQAQVANNNQTIAEQNAKYSIEAGQAAATQKSLEASNQQGAIRAAEAANNVDVNTGSAEEVQKSQRQIGKLDTLTTVNNSLLNAYGYQSQGVGFGAQSGLETATSKQAAFAGDIGAAGTVAGNAQNLAFKWSGGSTNPADVSNTYGTGVAAANSGSYGPNDTNWGF